MEKKVYLILLAVFLLNYTLSGQVTIGSGFGPVQAALLQIKDQEPKADNITSQTGGIVLPRVQLLNASTLEPFISTGDTEWINASTSRVKELHTGLMVYNLNTAAPFKQGIYIWDGSMWKYYTTSSDIQVLSSGNGITLNSGKVDIGGDLSVNATVNLNSKILGFTNGSIGIGTETPDASAALEINATNKGFLPPRVALTATNSASPITSPAVGLIVYNTANGSSGATAVYANNLYTWDGTKWSQLINQSTFDNTLQSSLNNLGVPRPAVFQLQGNIKNFLNTVAIGASAKVPMSMLVNNLLDDISFNSGTNVVTFKRGGLYTMTLVYEAEHNGTGCTLASYIVDFPDMNGARGDAPIQYTRIHSTAAFTQGALSNHGGTITCTAFIPTGRTWPIQLGRGQSGNCSGTGCTLIGRSTHFVITKVGDLPPAGVN
ncbi:hypothetical protein [Dysgonomonas sp. ZJ279]|uniref:hypothetical protein n=1 Tax=Dysgonomonas sp. ZJ279 TaxID=2709796 RepID=UPI0013EC410C|nr:hypothetical protein [Dysgonomonas sp. ZJ279]